MFDKYLEEKMIIRIEIWRDVFLKYLVEDDSSSSESHAADKADAAVKRFDKGCMEKPE